MGAATERLVPMPCCDHREIARHGEQTSNYTKLLNAIIDGIQLPQSNAQSSKGAVPVIFCDPIPATVRAYFVTRAVLKALTILTCLEGSIKDTDCPESTLNIMPADHLDQATHLTKLMTQLRDRFQRTGQMTDLEQVIQYGQQALEATPADHPDRARYLNNLGSGFEGRIQRTGQMTDLEQAIQYGQQAFEATPADHPDRARYLNNLGSGFEGRFQRTGQMTDLEQAI
jgi:tetratricopeptide (TPR) repeat protein